MPTPPLPTCTPNEDTGTFLMSGVCAPSRTRHTWLGACISFSILLWIGAGTSVVVALAYELRGVLPTALLAAAVTASLATCVIAVSTQQWRAQADDHKALHDQVANLGVDVAALRTVITGVHAETVTGIGAVSAEMEQISERLSRIDPWTIYTAVAADILGQEANGTGRDGR